MLVKGKLSDFIVMGKLGKTNYRKLLFSILPSLNVAANIAGSFRYLDVKTDDEETLLFLVNLG